jgi:hypothetical protein
MKWQKFVEQWQRTRRALRSRLRELVDQVAGADASPARMLRLEAPRSFALEPVLVKSDRRSPRGSRRRSW